MTRVMSLSSLGGAIELGQTTGIKALAQLRGTGLPPVSTQWFEGAGDGATFRGGRNLARVLDIPLKVYGANREAVRARLSLLGRIFALPNVVRLTVSLDGDEWFVDVVRTGGGDWTWGSDTDGSTFVKTVITAQAGDPFWQRVDSEARNVVPGGGGRGLLRAGVSLTQLQLSSSSGFGAVDFENTGDVAAPGIWTINAPFTGFTLISPTGEAITWGTGGNGALGASKATGFIKVDTELGTVVDETGANKYTGLAAVPRFWSIPPGASKATIVAYDPNVAVTTINVVWNARRWVMF